MKKLKNAKVAVFGLGGVGGYVCEALARSGVGSFVLIDKDTVDITNLNRQIIATLDTVGKDKTEVMKERILSINPEAQTEIHNCFFLPENSDEFDFAQYDYVVDAVDTVAAKIEIILKAQSAGTPVISSMGAGNKLDPTRFQVADIYKTSVCPLAKVMRHELKKRGVKKLKVVYSDELPLKAQSQDEREFSEADNKLKQSENSADSVMLNNESENRIRRKDTPGSIIFTPAACGLAIASEVVKDLIQA